jgi:antirestriction protein ArdC/phage/plasmid primase-like uncharacterized protein
MSEKKSYRDQVVEELLTHIEAGTAPWQKPWDPGKVRLGPFNPVSGANYRGINAIWLETRGHEDPRWMTYRQATQQDAQVRKGEKGTKIEYWKWTDKRALLDDEGRPVLDDDGKVKTREVRLDRPQVFHAVVFNAEQIDGLAPFIAPKPAFEPAERAEELLRLDDVPIFHGQKDRAFYNVMKDEIHLPPQHAFRSQYDYYATALHELGHATGHQSRMAREFGPFGSEVYAKEELRAEIASYMLTTELGLGHYPERHAAYVGNWMKAIREDRNFLFTAARDAENIRTWVTEPGKREELKPVLSQEQRQEKLKEERTFIPAVGEGDARQNWLNYAAYLEGLGDVDRSNLGSVAYSFEEFKPMWRNSTIPAVQERALKSERETFASMTELAGRSRKHAELLSVMYETRPDQEYLKPRRPQWFIPAEQRTSEIVKSLGSDPGQTMADRFIAERKQRQEQGLAARAKEEQRPPKKRHYLNVPFNEKNDAKRLGAKWDRRAKSWYVYDDADLKPFARWNEPAIAKPQSRMRPEEEFALACRENGLVIDGPPTMDGKWHRVSVESDRKGQKSGSYRGFIEGIPAGNIVNYKSGNEPVKWVSAAAERNPAEIERSKAEAAARKAQMEENLKAQYKQVAKRAYAMVQGADTASGDHVYLQRKQVGGETLKQDIHNNLLMPMTTAKGFIENVQVITPDGSKRFLKDGRKTGLMHIIPGSKKGPILIAEGFATGKSLNMATGYQTAIAMDSGNLAPVAEALQKAFPDRSLIIAADDDHRVEARQGINPGLKGAERAAAWVEAAVIKPNLSPAEKQAGLTDFNDLHVARGIDSLAKTVKQQIKELGLTQKLQKVRTLPAPKQQHRHQGQQVAM